MKRLFLTLGLLGTLSILSTKAASFSITGVSILNLSSDAFRVRPNDVGSCTVGGSNIIYTTTSNAECNSYAPIFLPAGTTISYIDVYTKDRASTCTVSVSLKKISRTGAATDVDTQITAADTGYQTLTLNGTTMSTDSSYSLFVKINNTSTITDCYIIGAAVAY